MTLGQAIRDNRVRLNMTQAELADRIGVSQKVVSKYEKGICRPSIENVAVLAHVFGIAVDDLLGGSTDIPEREVTFFERLEHLIRNNGTTPNKLLTDLRLSRNSLVCWRKRGTIPSAEVVADIAEYFGVSIEYLLGREDTHLAVLESKSILDEGFSFKGILSISDRNYRISLSITPSGEELNG